MWGKIIIPMYRLWLHDLYGLYGPRCPLSPKKADKLNLSLSAIAVMLAVSCYYLFRKSAGYVYEFGSTKYLVKLKSYLRGKDYFVLQRYSVTGNGCLWGKVPGIWIWIQMWLKFEQTSFSCVITSIPMIGIFLSASSEASLSSWRWSDSNKMEIE